MESDHLNTKKWVPKYQDSKTDWGNTVSLNQASLVRIYDKEYQKENEIHWRK